MNKITIIALLISSLSISQVQIGNDIDGIIAEEESGESVSLSADGNIIAIGSPNNNNVVQLQGKVKVYSNQSGIWTQVGNDIIGESVNDRFGEVVSISNNGDILAVGAPNNNGNGQFSGHVRIFENQSGNWVQIGSDIDGENADDRSGTSISLSGDATRIAIGAFTNNGNGTFSGHVRIFENQSGNWVQIGSDIDGESSFDESGSSVSLSDNGNIVAIGARRNNGNGSSSGHVRIFEDQSGNWVQIGSDIDGEASNDQSGSSVSLSGDGNTVAIGAFLNQDGGQFSGHVRVYRNQSGNWIQIGSDIDGENAFDTSGLVTTSFDGNIIAISATNNNGNGSSSGHVRIYRFVNNTWNQIGSDIDGESQGDRSGSSISLSSNGSIAAIGAIGNSDNGNNAGHVRVFDLSTVLSLESFITNLFKVIYNNQQQTIEVNLTNTNQLKQINLYTVSGKYLYTVNDTIIDISSLTSGIYIVEVETSKGKSVQKVIIQ